MKNIHVLPTDKYSDLVYSTNKYGGYFLSKHYSPMKDMGDSYQNIYITSDEEIKDRDWVLNTHTNDVYFLKGYYGIQPIIKKIIITTDQDLIKDGVQPIDDEFLEWFVKNPSCEEVDVNKSYGGTYYITYPYKIIIPKEEPKQDKIMERFIANAKQQETLEEAAERLCVFKNSNINDEIRTVNFKLGAKWQQKRSYSEEEVYDLMDKREHYWVRYKNYYAQSYIPFDEWFEQFKKK